MPAVLAHGQVGHPIAILFQALAGIEHGLVLGNLGDDVISPLPIHLRNALNSQIVGFGRAAGEDDLFRCGVNQPGNLAPGAFHGLLRRPTERVVAAGCIAEFLIEVRQHRAHHAWIHRRGGVVIHVNWQLDAHLYFNSSAKARTSAT